MRSKIYNPLCNSKKLKLVQRNWCCVMKKTQLTIILINIPHFILVFLNKTINLHLQKTPPKCLYTIV